MIGIVKTLMPRRLFGFIKAEDGKEYFFHRDDFKGFWDDLVADDSDKDVEVTFDIVESTKGLRAGNVSRTDFPNQAV